MKIDVVFLPKGLTEAHVRDRAVVVFDVLRATTTMTAALAMGAKEIRAFPNLNDARASAQACSDPRLLCGEFRCLRPEGFDLGNSPGAYVQKLVADKTLFMSTTNGTRAIAAASGASKLYVAALVNAAAIAKALLESGRDVTLLCAGTDGEFAMEDILGAGAVLDELVALSKAALESDRAMLAVTLYRACRADLLKHLRDSTGARNVIQAGLPEDVEFAARLNVFDVVGEVDPRTLVIRASSFKSASIR